MEVLLQSFLTVSLSEIGDKTQLLALLLSAQFRKPWPIISGILVATLFNHALAALVGEQAIQFVPPEWKRIVLTALFVIFALWALIPDQEGKPKSSGQWGVFLTTLISFFLAEMGDKTQLATLALAGQHQNVSLVTLGTTLGMMAANAPVVFWGERILKIIPLKVFRVVSCVMFLAFAIFLWVS